MKTLKKILIALFGIIMLMTFNACSGDDDGNSATDNKFVGTWHYSNLTLNMHSNGKYERTNDLFGNKTSGKWSYNSENETLTFVQESPKNYTLIYTVITFANNYFVIMDIDDGEQETWKK
ncbi:MAG: hypothetical protein IJ250_01285 [Bacteroidales bacterium]|nr:hypothetical protein [Bacteroidales bacterium]